MPDRTCAIRAQRKYREKNREKVRELSRERYQKNREKELIRQRKWREENLELKRRIMKECARRRRAEQPEKTRAIQRKARETASSEQRENRLTRIREWYMAHRDEQLEYKRNYWQKPDRRDQERIRSKNRKAWAKQATGKFTHVDIQALYEKQNGKCAICAVAFPETGTHRFEIDHIIPLKPRGASLPVGTNNPTNLQLLCRRCNRSKSNHYFQ